MHVKTSRYSTRMPKSGRPRKKGRLHNFRLQPKAARALAKIACQRGWTMTATVERSILFAETHPDFGVLLKEVA